MTRRGAGAPRGPRVHHRSAPATWLWAGRGASTPAAILSTALAGALLLACVWSAAALASAGSAASEGSGAWADADLLIEALTVSDPSPAPGDEVALRLSVRNDGPAGALDAVVGVPMPVGLSYASDDGGAVVEPSPRFAGSHAAAPSAAPEAPAGAYDPSTGLWRIGPLAAGVRARIAITLSVDDPPSGPTASGAFIDRFVPPGSGGLSGPVDLKFIADGDLLVASSGSDAVLRYDGTSGDLVGVVAAPGAGGLARPDGLAIAGNGDLLVASAGSGAVLRFDAGGAGFLGQLVAPGAGGLGGPGDLLWLGGRGLLVADVDAASVLRFAESDGAPAGAFVAAGAGALRKPFGLERAPNGDLLVADADGDALRRYDGGTGDPLGDFVAPRSGGLVGPDRIAFGPDGRLYAASAGTSEVLRYAGESGDFVDAFVERGAGGLAAPSGLTFGPDGHLYVASFETDAVLRYDGFIVVRAAVRDAGADASVDPDPSNDRRSAAIAVRTRPSGPLADLRAELAAVGLTDEPGPPVRVVPSSERVTAGRQATITLRASNRGPGAALDARAVISLPDGAEWLGGGVEGLGGEACESDAAPDDVVVTCRLGDLVVGAARSAHIAAGVDPDMAAGTDFSAAVRLDAGAADAEPGDNRAIAALRVETRSDLAVELDVASDLEPERDPGPSAVSGPVPGVRASDGAEREPVNAALGDAVTISLAVRNLGPSTARGAQLHARVPAGLILQAVEASGGACAIELAGGGLRCSAAGLAPGAAVSASAAGRLVDGLTGRREALSAGLEALAGGGIDLHPDNDEADAALAVSGPPSDVEPADLAVAVHAAEPVRPAAGGTVGLSVRVDNRGPAEARSVRVAQWLPRGLEFEPTPAEPGSGTVVSGPTLGRAGDSGPRVWKVERIPAGGFVELNAVARAAALAPAGGRAGTGARLGLLGGGLRLDGPGKMALGPDGDLYVAYQRGAVRRFDGASGADRGWFVAPESGLRFASGLAWGPGGDLLVADAAADSVLRFDGIDGHLLDAFVPPGSAGLATPSDLAWGPDGHLYVADGLGSRVLRFDGGSGEPLGAAVAAGSSGVSVPSALEFTAGGGLWVASFGSGQLLLFDVATGEMQRLIDTRSAGLGRPADLAVGPDGAVFAGGEAGGTVWRFEAGDGGGAVFGEAAAAVGAVGGLAFGRSGELLVADSSRGVVEQRDGFPVVWARVAAAGSSDPDLTDDRLATMLFSPWGSAGTPGPGPGPTATPELANRAHLPFALR